MSTSKPLFQPKPRRLEHAPEFQAQAGPPSLRRNRGFSDRHYLAWKAVFDNCRKGIGWVAPALSICNVARGRVDAFIDTGCSMEGQAAAGFILQKAGGMMFDDGFRDYHHVNQGGIFCCRAFEGALRTGFTE